MMKPKQAGFTIIELLIATVVFSIVLLVLAGGIIQIGRLYYKGITSARTQQAARQAVDTITQSIQFNSGTIIPTTNTNLTNSTDSQSRAFCIGTQHYMYRIGQQRTGTMNALLNSDIPGGCTSTVADNMSIPVTKGSELLGENMRLSNIVVQPETGPSPANANLYRVTVRVVYGDYDLLCRQSDPAGCDDSVPVFNTENSVLGINDLACKNIRSGSQFCAVSELSTIVERRL